MLRRSFLAMLGLGSLAGETAGIGSALGKPGFTSPPLFPSQSVDVVTQTDPVSLLRQLRKEYDGVVKDKERFMADMIADYMNNEHYDRRICNLDPDIAAMKSFSDVTKVRVQMTRRAERRWAEAERSLSRQILYYVDQVSEKKGTHT